MRRWKVAKREEWEDYAVRRRGERSEEMRIREERGVERLCRGR